MMSGNGREAAGGRDRVLRFVIGSLGTGGAERVAVTMGDRPPEGYRIAMSLLTGENAYAWSGPIECLEVDMYAPGRPALEKLGSLLRGTARLHARLRTERPEVVVGFTTWPNLVTVAASPRSVRTVITVHTVESIGIRGRSAGLVRAAARWAYPRADAILAVSPGIALDLEESYGVDHSRIRVIPNPIDVNEVRSRAHDSVEGSGFELPRRPYLVHVGRHTEPKGLDSLLRIQAELRRTMQAPPQLVLVGSGPLTNRLLQLAGALGLSTHGPAVSEPHADQEAADVLFVGRQSNPFPWLAGAHAFLMPSLWEGLPVAPIEALAVGTPVVVADCVSGPREILAPETGLPRELVEPELTRHGLLMPTTGQTIPVGFREEIEVNKAERVWAETVRQLFDRDESLLQELAAKSRHRAMDFDVTTLSELWWSAVLGS